MDVRTGWTSEVCAVLAAMRGIDIASGQVQDQTEDITMRLAFILCSSACQEHGVGSPAKLSQTPTLIRH